MILPAPKRSIPRRCAALALGPLGALRQPGRLVLLLIPLLGLTSCQQPKRAPTPARPRRQVQPFNLAALGVDRQTTLRALRMRPHEVVARLGSHRLTCSSRLTTRLPGQPEQVVNQEVSVSNDKKGQYAAIKNTHPQYGREVIWAGGWLYPRLRHQKFLRRRPEPEEPARTLDRLAALLPAYVRLLGGSMSFEPGGRAGHQGRPAVKVKLALAADPAPPATESAPARQWRRSLRVRKLAGEALLDARTGAPLLVTLRAGWTFHPPAAGPLPESGIPQQLDQAVEGRTELDFKLQITDLGKVADITPPAEADTVDSPRLTRIEVERQMLTGELPLDEQWGPPP